MVYEQKVSAAWKRVSFDFLLCEGGWGDTFPCESVCVVIRSSHCLQPSFQDFAFERTQNHLSRVSANDLGVAVKKPSTIWEGHVFWGWKAQFEQKIRHFFYVATSRNIGFGG